MRPVEAEFRSGCRRSAIALLRNTPLLPDCSPVAACQAIAAFFEEARHVGCEQTAIDALNLSLRVAGEVVAGPADQLAIAIDLARTLTAWAHEPLSQTERGRSE